ncbi:hypothetical protein GQR58_019828 [Nymphon striatum]|nr:hypothetical protein GQR58_019828 [Nymphon striatum]
MAMSTNLRIKGYKPTSRERRITKGWKGFDRLHNTCWNTRSLRLKTGCEEEALCLCCAGCCEFIRVTLKPRHPARPEVYHTKAGRKIQVHRAFWASQDGSDRVWRVWRASMKSSREVKIILRNYLTTYGSGSPLQIRQVMGSKTSPGTCQSPLRSVAQSSKGGYCTTQNRG